jgi:hypothetical protein
MPSDGTYDEVYSINSHHGYETDNYTPIDECDDGEADYYEASDCAFVLLNDDFGYNSFDPSLRPIIKWLIEQSPWSSAIASTIEEWDDGKFYVRAIDCPSDLAVQALCLFRDMGRSPNTFSDVWESMIPANCPDAHKFVVLHLFGGSGSYMSWDKGDGALFRYDMDKEEYRAYLQGRRVGVGCTNRLSISSIGGYAMSLAGQWGGCDELCDYDDSKCGEVARIFEKYARQVVCETVKGMFQTYQLNIITDWCSFAEQSYNLLMEDV